MSKRSNRAFQSLESDLEQRIRISATARMMPKLRINDQKDLFDFIVVDFLSQRNSRNL